MIQEQNDTNLLDDKYMAEKLFSKEALDQLESINKNVPVGYFDNHGKSILNAIHASKNKGIVFKLGVWGKMAIAASLLTIALTTYIFVQSNNKKTGLVNNLTIQEIPTAEIESYVNVNEAIAEIDWQTEINKEFANLDIITNGIKKDSNNTQ